MAWRRGGRFEWLSIRAREKNLWVSRRCSCVARRLIAIGKRYKSDSCFVNLATAAAAGRGQGGERTTSASLLCVPPAFDIYSQKTTLLRHRVLVSGYRVFQNCAHILWRADRSCRENNFYQRKRENEYHWYSRQSQLNKITLFCITLHIARYYEPCCPGRGARAQLYRRNCALLIDKISTYFSILAERYQLNCAEFRS